MQNGARNAWKRLWGASDDDDDGSPLSGVWNLLVVFLLLFLLIVLFLFLLLLVVLVLFLFALLFLDQTQSMVRALTHTLAVRPPHVCRRQRDEAVSVGSHMQQDMGISNAPPHPGVPIPLFERKP